MTIFFSAIPFYVQIHVKKYHLVKFILFVDQRYIIFNISPHVNYT